MNPSKTATLSLQGAIGVFDSGVGGLSVLREIVRQIPQQPVLYFADTGHVPYGDREASEIRSFAQAITAFLVEQGARVVVVACNTASAVALYPLRDRFDLPIVGMEPAVKPAAERTHSQQIGVIATQATFQGQLFARLVERFAQGARIHTQVCPGLVEQVEAGQIDDPETEALLRDYLSPMLEAGIDSLVLGCTHYAFLRPTIERIVGPEVAVIDPAPAVARQTARVWAQLDETEHRALVSGQVTYFVSGDPVTFQTLARHLTGIPGAVVPVQWVGGTPRLAAPPQRVKSSP